MINRITKETRKLWQNEIAYTIRSYTDTSVLISETIATDILKYLEDEGAFTVIDESEA